MPHLSMDDTLAGLRRRREAARRLPPLECCGCRDPWTCRHHDDPKPYRRLWPVVSVSAARGALRRAWCRADPADRAVLAEIADLLTEIAEPMETA